MVAETVGSLPKGRSPAFRRLMQLFSGIGTVLEAPLGPIEAATADAKHGVDGCYGRDIWRRQVKQLLRGCPKRCCILYLS
jgi:hypothetical protein